MFLKISFIFQILIFYSYAQNISINGIVKDTSGNGIPAANVWLEKGNLSCITNADGSFTLAGVYTSVNDKQFSHNFVKDGINLNFNNNNVTFHIAHQSLVAVRIFNLQGKCVYSSNSEFYPGEHILHSPAIKTGCYIYNININSNVFTTKISVINGGVSFAKSLTEHSIIREKKSGSKARIDDIISFSKDGFLTDHLYIYTSDTVGFETTLLNSAGTIKDIEGNDYQTVKIGKQIWTAENFRSTTFTDGTKMNFIEDMKGIIYLDRPYYAFYGNDRDYPQRLRRYGVVYNWYTTISKKFAPEGWRVPSKADYDTLLSFLNSQNYNCRGPNTTAKTIAAKITWSDHNDTCSIGFNTVLNNKSGFSAVSTGIYFEVKNSFNRGADGHFWTSTSGDEDNGYSLNLYYSSVSLKIEKFYKDDYFPIRFVKDDL